MKTGRLNVYVPQPELEAFRKFCEERKLSQSRVITGLLHTFNARRAKMEAKELDRFAKNLEAASHLRFEQERAKARTMVTEAGKAPTGDSSSVEQDSADFLDLE